MSAILIICFAYTAVTGRPAVYMDDGSSLSALAKEPINEESFYLNNSQTFTVKEMEGNLETGRVRIISRMYLEDFSIELSESSGFLDNTPHTQFTLRYRDKGGNTTRFFTTYPSNLKQIELERGKVVELETRPGEESMIISCKIIDYKDGKPSYR